MMRAGTAAAPAVLGLSTRVVAAGRGVIADVSSCDDSLEHEDRA